MSKRKGHAKAWYAVPGSMDYLGWASVGLGEPKAAAAQQCKADKKAKRKAQKKAKRISR